MDSPLKCSAALLAVLVFGCGCAQNAPQITHEAPENTYWKLTQLGAAPVRVRAAPQQREAHFILHPADKRVVPRQSRVKNYIFSPAG